jgi:trimethylamine--corrinoid protein Co-methyltransferase
VGNTIRSITVRPTVRFLTDDLIKQIIDEAIGILCSLGLQIHNKQILSMLADHGAKVDMDNFHVNLAEDIIQKAIRTAPHSFKLYDVMGNQTHDFSDYNVHFTPGSTALNILDCQTQQMRKPLTNDFIDFSKIMAQLENIASTSTAFIPTDVHEKISDSYRLFLSLLYCEKPVVTGAFTAESFNVMKDLQLAVRNSESQLKKKPLTIFSCCPTSPLKWCEVTSQNLIDCARYSIPVEFVAMPLSGFMAPVTLTGTLIQHTAETLSGVVISQLSNAGTPILYGGSPAVFDHRYETTPMGAVETMMTDCAYNEIGKFLNLPTQAYISMSDSKQLDAQAGLESGAGATLAALAGINSISGPGMVDFESCQSLEKLVLDNEMCGMTFRLIDGITPREDFPALPIFQELLREKHLLIADHTTRYRHKEIFLPGPAIDRANRQRWKQQGAMDLNARLHNEVNKLLKTYQPSTLPETTKKDLVKLMEKEARRHGQDHLPLPPMTT